MQPLINALKVFLIVICTTVLSPTALSAPVHVEVIVFSHNDRNAGYEWFMKPAQVIKVEDLVDEDVSLVETESTDQIQPATNPLENLDNTGPLPVKAYVLTEFAKSIEQNPNFELLNYISWIQEPVPKSRTKSISLDIPLDESIFSDQLLIAGTTSVYEIAQLLQFDINITYKPNADISKATVYLPEAVSLYVPSVTYQLEERRQVQINDVHYFDHPKIGVVFTIIRPKQPELFIQ